MLPKNLKSEELLNKNQSNILIGFAGIVNTNINFQRAIWIILCEPIYDSKLIKQIFKRAHRQQKSERDELFRDNFKDNDKIKRLMKNERRDRNKA